MKKLSLFLIAALLIAALSGCAGTTVVVGNCTCPTDAHVTPTQAPAETAAPAETSAPVETSVPAGTTASGAVKTGLAIVTDLSDCTNASEGGDGQVKFDVNFAAVTLDENGVILSCLLDSLGAAVTFDQSGAITSDVNAPVKTKNELGEAYGMKAYAGSQFEWNEQAASFAAYVTGKTADQVAGIAVDEKNAPADADLAAGVTIAIGGFQALIAKALS